MLDLKTETYLCVCREMNFTRAAEALNITQPAVTQQIHALEEYYGVPLFEFEGKKFHMTEYGLMIRDSLISMQNNERYLRERLNVMKSRHELINMGATLTVGEYMMSDCLASYLASHPSADVSMQVANTSTLLSRLDDGTIDFAVLEGNYSRSEYKHRLVFNEDFIGICSADCSLAGRSLCLSDLSDTRLILREPGSGTRDILEEALDSAGVSINDFSNVTTIGDMRAIIALVIKNCGITFLYERAVSPLLKAGQIKRLSINGFPIRHEISAVWRSDNLQGKYIEGLIDELINKIE